MQPFDFNCTTCQKNLRVSNEALLGQILNCPACGSMVQIPDQEPELRWEENGFDQTPVQPPPVPVSTEDKDTIDDFGYESTDSQSSEENIAPDYDSGELPDNLLPTPDWADKSNSKKKLFIGAGIVSSLLIVLLIISFIASSDDAHSIAAVTPDDQNDVNVINHDEEVDADNSDQLAEDSDLDQNTDGQQTDIDSTTQENLAERGTHDPQVGDPPNEQEAPGDSEPMETDNTNNEPETPASDTETPMPPGLKPNMQTESDNEQLNMLLQNVAPFIGSETTDMPNTNALEESDIPAPPESENSIIVPNAPAQAIDPASAVQLEIAAVRFPNPILLKQFTGFIQELTGVPVTIDATALANSGFDINTTVNVVSVESSIEDILNNVLKSASLSWRIDGNQIVVGPVGHRSKEPLQVVYDVASLANGNDGGDLDAWKKLLAKLAVGNKTSVESTWDGSNWSVEATPNVHTMIRVTAGQLQSVTSANPNAETLLPRWVRIQPLLQQKTDLDLSRGAKIQRVASHLSKDVNGNILVNWNSLWEIGWDLNSSIPLVTDEQPLKDVLDALLTSMHLTYIPCTADTLVITSPSAARAQRWTEFYKLAVEDDEAAAEAVQLFKEHVLEAHDNPDEADIHIEALGNWIAVRASPLDHRRLVEAIGIQ